MNTTNCSEIARQHDKDRFAATLLMPPEKREALWALLAFNHEIARTREVVSETTMGLIRLQWWRDALKAFYEDGQVQNHEILAPLTTAIKEHYLPRDTVESLIYAREFDLEDVVPTSLEGLINYADYTTTPLNKLILQVLGEDDDAVQPISTAYALIGLLRAVPFHTSQRRCFLPADIMSTQGIAEGQLYAGKIPDALPNVITTIREEAEKHLQTETTSKWLRSQQKTASLYSQQIRANKCDIYSSKLQYPPPFFHLRFLWAMR